MGLRYGAGMALLCRLILTLCLVAGLATGAVAHAGELDNEVAAAVKELHAAGDHDRAPLDSDKGVPHHHSICHGHELAGTLKTTGPAPFARAALPRPAANVPPLGASPGALLRPPIV